MTTLDNLHQTDAPYTTFEWVTDEKTWDDFIQTTENYYRKGFGLVHENEVYVDEYAVHQDPPSFVHRLGFDIDSLPTHSFVFGIQKGVLEIYEPKLADATSEDVVHVLEFAVSLEMENHYYLKWAVDSDRWQRTRIRSMKNNVGKYDHQ